MKTDIKPNEGFLENRYGKTRANVHVDIRYNGGIPFKVRICPKNKTVQIAKIMMESMTYEVAIPPIKYTRIFVGRDASGRYGTGSVRDRFYGNSILFQLKSDPETYVFIGWKIFSFRPNDHIVSYRSDMGNSGVPYPFAVGIDNTYLMLEQVFIPNEMLSNDPYAEFYGHNGRKISPKNCKKFRRVRLLQDRMF